jgi:hypothetical protein
MSHWQQTPQYRKHALSTTTDLASIFGLSLLSVISASQKKELVGILFVPKNPMYWSDLN